MKRSKLVAAAALVLSVAVSVGATAPAAVAGPHKTKHSASAKAHKAHKAPKVKASKAERQLAGQQDRALARIDRTDTRLARADAEVTDSGLAQADLVLANIETDRVALADLATAVEDATTRAEVRVLDGQVRDFRQSVYATVLTGLSQLAHFESVAEVEALEPVLTEPVLTEPVVTDPVLTDPVV